MKTAKISSNHFECH